jgi:peptide chain release factor 1
MREMAKEELGELEAKLPIIEQELKLLLLPKDPNDERNVILEIRAGAGGDEASIFVADMWRMYKNYFNAKGWKSEVVSISEGDRGLKEIVVNVSGDKVYSRMKYESGVHRVQRVPDTEAQGRVHTSTITVAVMPEADEVGDVELNMNEIRIDVYRSSGSGGQSVNTSDSAVRLTHLPTGIVIAMQDERSQLKNKDKAFKILKTKIFDLKVQEAAAKEAATRKGLVGTGDRSERIRTYNYPQGRISDHRINFTIYNLSSFMNGDIDEVIDALIAHNQAILLQGAEE